MNDEGHLHDLARLWRGQSAEQMPMTLEEVRQHAATLQGRIGRRNRREYIAAAIVIVVAVAMMARGAEATLKIGGALMAAGVLFVVYYLYRWGSARMMPADLALQDCLSFHRAELVRQRDLLNSAWWWYLLPLVPGAAFVTITHMVQHPERRLFLGSYSVVFILSFVGIGWLNHRAARKIQRRIDGLDSRR